MGLKIISGLLILLALVSIMLGYNIYNTHTGGIDVRIEDGSAMKPKYLTPVISIKTMDAVSLSVLVETQKAIQESYAIHVRHTVRTAYAHAMFNDYEQADSTVISALKPYGIHVIKLHVYRNVETYEYKAVDLP